MAKLYAEITSEIAAWIGQQHLFFVATAPVGIEGHINCSPKGLDTLRILGPKRVAYLDLTGSGAETIAHLRENGRVVILFCAFAGPPKIVRLHGRGQVLTPASADWPGLRSEFPEYPGARTIILVDVSRISDSCGYSVPKFEYVEERDALQKWAQKNGTDGLAAYRQLENAQSIDGLPALEQEK
ncbi:MAG: pyridoxamine 5'-phosphate oxidase family protein [Verrucomicrobia bacterium]|nr:pyridoxamine 5'-phosphate oxidase family protein [Verrucomicrobiota bacterium]